MVGAEMDIVLGAKVDAGIANMNKFNATLVKTTQTADQFSVKTKTNFTGLSRVIQDLPFGFVAISNNLEQLISSAVPLGLVFSAIVSTLTFLQVGFSYWTRGIKQNKEELNEFTKSLKSAEAGATATGVKLQNFVNIARDSSRSLEERNNALREANNILGDHAQKLTLVTVGTQAATEEVNKFTTALINQALASKFADRVADLMIKQKDASKAYGAALSDYNKERKKSNDLDAGASASPFFNAQVTQNDILIKKYKDVSGAAANYKDITKQLTSTNQELFSLQLQGLQAVIPKQKESSETIAKILADLNTELTKDNLLEKALGVDETSQKISALESAIDRLLKIKVDPNSALINQLLGDISVLQLPQTLQNFAKFVKKNFAAEVEKAPFQGVSIADSIVHLSDIEAKNSLESMRDALQKAGRSVFSNQGILSDVSLLNDDEVKKNFDNLNNSIQSTAILASDVLGPAFDSVFNSIADGQNAFAALGSAIKHTIARLAAAAAEAAVLAIIINLATGGTGSLLKGFGSIFSQLSGIPKFAHGGVVTSPTLLVAGDRGPERITPVGYEGAASGNLQVEVVGQLSGDIIYLQQKRVAQRRGFTN
jgi:hypothetical protein